MSTINKEQFDFIRVECQKFCYKRGEPGRTVDVGDVLYTYFHPGFVLNDWEVDERDEIVGFINDVCSSLKENSLPPTPK